MPAINRKAIRQKIHRRIRKKISGTAERPRLAVSISNRHVYAQMIDDDAGVTLVAASSKDADVGSHQANVETAAKVGKVLADRAKAAKIDVAVFDRGGRVFHGRVKALADAAREGGLTI